MEMRVELRLLYATPDADSLMLLESLLASALELTPLQVTTAHVATTSALMARADSRSDDIILLDWPMAYAATPQLVHELLERNPQLRIVALLPASYRQYRREVWRAGACSSIAKENMEQEWLSSVLCVMHRAMQREAKIHAYYAANKLPTAALEESEVCCPG
jgi:DNA-binding NarL/FixJ family response regulator